ncbi:MAG: hypothetical protein Q9195_002816 [Heterodermia aff. obscurata]
MHWLLWGPITIVFNIVAYYHGKHDLRTLVRPTIQQWPENQPPEKPVIEVPRFYEPEVFSQNDAINTLDSISIITIESTLPIQEAPLVGPDVATDYDPVSNVLPLIMLISALLLFGSIWWAILFRSTSYLHPHNIPVVEKPPIMHMNQDYPVALISPTSCPPEFVLHHATYLASSALPNDDIENRRRAHRSRNVTRPEIIPLEASSNSRQLSTFVATRSDLAIFLVLMHQLFKMNSDLQRNRRSWLYEKAEFKRKLHGQDKKIKSLQDSQQESEREKCEEDDIARLELQVLVEDLREESADLTAKNRSLKQNGNKLCKGQKELTATIEKLEAQVKEVKEKAEKLTEQNQQLSANNQQITTENENLSNDNRQLSIANGELTKANEKLSGDNSQLVKAKDELSDSNCQLVKDKAELSDSNCQLVKDKRDLTWRNGQLLKARAEISTSYDKLNSRFSEADQARSESSKRNRELTKSNHELSVRNNNWAELSQNFGESIKFTESFVAGCLKDLAPNMKLSAPPDQVAESMRFIYAGVFALGTALYHTNLLVASMAKAAATSSPRVEANGEDARQVSPPSIVVSPPTNEGISGKEVLKNDGASGNGHGERGTGDSTLLTPPSRSSRTRKGKMAAATSSDIGAKESRAARPQISGIAASQPSLQIAMRSFTLRKLVIWWAVRYYLEAKSTFDRQSFGPSFRFKTRLDILMSFLAINEQIIQSIIRQMPPAGFQIEHLTLPGSSSLSANRSSSQGDDHEDSMDLDEVREPEEQPATEGGSNDAGMDVDANKNQQATEGGSNDPGMDVDTNQNQPATEGGSNDAGMDVDVNQNQPTTESGPSDEGMDVDVKQQQPTTESGSNDEGMDVDDNGEQTAPETGSGDDSMDVDGAKADIPDGDAMDDVVSSEQPDSPHDNSPYAAVAQAPPRQPAPESFNFNLTPPTVKPPADSVFNNNSASAGGAGKSFFGTAPLPKKNTGISFTGFQPSLGFNGTQSATTAFNGGQTGFNFSQPIASKPSPSFDLSPFSQKLPEFSLPGINIGPVTGSSPFGAPMKVINFANNNTAAEPFKFNLPPSADKPKARAPQPPPKAESSSPAAKPKGGAQQAAPAKTRSEFIKMLIDQHEDIRKNVIAIDVEVTPELLAVSMKYLKRSQMREVVNRAIEEALSEDFSTVTKEEFENAIEKVLEIEASRMRNYVAEE